MSLARMSAGSGYRYLLRHTAVGDTERAPRKSLTSYYAASGNPTRALARHRLSRPVRRPPRANAATWRGRDRRSDGRPLRPRAQSRPPASSLAGLTRSTRAPRTGSPRRLPGVPTRWPPQRGPQQSWRSGAGESRPVAVGGCRVRPDLHSAEVDQRAVAIGDEAVQAAVAEAHRDATGRPRVDQERLLFTRTGTNSCMQVDTHGMIAAAFDHYGSRSGTRTCTPKWSSP